jgi:hypothetical protein
MSIMDFGQDLSTQEAPPLLPAGPYPAEIIGAQERQSKSSGQPFIDITFRIHSESYPADFTEGDPDGIELHYMRLQSDWTKAQNRWRMKRFLERVGAPLTTQVDLNDLVGRTATVEVSHGEWNEEAQLQINRILAP